MNVINISFKKSDFDGCFSENQNCAIARALRRMSIVGHVKTFEVTVAPFDTRYGIRDTKLNGELIEASDFNCEAFDRIAEARDQPNWSASTVLDVDAPREWSW